MSLCFSFFSIRLAALGLVLAGSASVARAELVVRNPSGDPCTLLTYRGNRGPFRVTTQDLHRTGLPQVAEYNGEDAERTTNIPVPPGSRIVLELTGDPGEIQERDWELLVTPPEGQAPAPEESLLIHQRVSADGAQRIWVESMFLTRFKPYGPKTLVVGRDPGFFGRLKHMFKDALR